MKMHNILLVTLAPAIAALALGAQAGTAQAAPKITATWDSTAKGVKVSGTGFFFIRDPNEGGAIELILEQNGADSNNLIYYYDLFDADARGNFSGNQCKGAIGGDASGNDQVIATKCTFKTYVTASCLVGVTALDEGTDQFTPAVNVRIPSRDCPGAKITAKQTTGTRNVTVSGTGFTPESDLFSTIDQDDGTSLDSRFNTASGTLRPGPYPTNGGKFSYTVTAPASACGHTLVITIVDDYTDFQVSTSLPLNC